MEIHVPTVPRHLTITQGMWEDFLWDPVLAAWVILGFRFDAFQNCRLRYYWFVQHVEDHSGFSSGKTIVDWAFLQLRMILIPNQEAGVYYPVFETGKNTFWRYYTTCKSRLFHAQIGRTDEQGYDAGSGKIEGAGSFKAYYRNGNLLTMPAPSFMKKASTQASMRFNVELIEEWTHIDAGSTGIDDQLIGRVTRECWNQHHPVWGNHIILSAPAKTRMHPGFTRHHAIESAWLTEGDPKSHTMGYSYKDYSDLAAVTGKTFREQYRIQSTIDAMKKKHDKSSWLGEGLGVWATSGKGWFTEESLLQCVDLGRRRKLEPAVGRTQHVEQLNRNGAVPEDLVFFFGGVDPAPSEGHRSDEGAIVVAAAVPKVLPKDAEKLSENPADWHFEYVFARRLTKKHKASARQWSGILHKLHQAFRFERLVMDPNGGGTFVKRELILPQQTIDNVPVEVTPIADQDDGPALVVRGDFILHLFKRGDSGMESLWPSFAGDDVLNDAMYSEVKEAVDHQGAAWPAPYREWMHEHRDQLKLWPESKTWALINLDAMVKQFGSVMVAMDPANPEKFLFTRRNARMFSAIGKKDLVSAGMFAYVAFRIWLKAEAWTSGIKPENRSAFIGQVIGSPSGGNYG